MRLSCWELYEYLWTVQANNAFSSSVLVIVLEPPVQLLGLVIERDDHDDAIG